MPAAIAIKAMPVVVRTADSETRAGTALYSAVNGDRPLFAFHCGYRI